MATARGLTPMASQRQCAGRAEKLMRQPGGSVSQCTITLTTWRFSNTNFSRSSDRKAQKIHTFSLWGGVVFFNTLSMHHPYFPLVIIFAVAAVVVLALLLVASKVGPKSTNPAKAEPFESGNPPRGDARIRFSIRFYLVAMLFLIFDLEVVFLYPWAIYFRQLGVLGLVQMGIFLVILAIGYAYVWKKGALEWD
jgi:NADH-quinone oxidoreductase subunit A